MPQSARKYGQTDKPKQPRLSRSKRGYDADWYRFREWYANEHPPICIECDSSLPSRDMHLDHEPPLTGPDDPGRLDEARVRWMCKVCHSKKTVRDNGFGV